MKYKIVACIPCKNEEFCIEKVLKVLSLFCYKIIVNDDNSTDKTQEICKKFEKVELLIRRKRDPKNREGALQRQELLDKAYEYNPDYFFFIDADELPVPSIISFFENIDTSINTWFLPMRDLYKDEHHYRIDKFTTKHGIKRDFSKPITNKGFIVKNIKNYKLKYDITKHRCRPSNQPINSPKPHKLAGGEATILHYSKIKPYYLSGQSNMDRALWDNYTKGVDINKTLKHHELCWDETTLELEEIKDEWKWDNIMKQEEIVEEIQNKGFYILRNYKSKDFCNSILKQVNTYKNIPYNKGEGGDLRVTRFENYSNEAKEFLNDSFFLSIGKKILSHAADGKTKRCQLGILKYKKGANSGGGWHVDNHKIQYKAMIYLTDVNKNNGPFAMLYPNLKSTDYPAISKEKSTRFHDKIAIDHKDKIQLLTGSAGDVILFLSHNIHRGTNIKEGTRITLTNYYYDGIYTK